MDAQQWHTQATVTPVALPQPVTATELEAMSPAARQQYANTVRVHLRASPVSSPMHEVVRAGLSEDLDSTLMEPPGARTILALSAPWGVGKSTLVTNWASAQHRQWVGDEFSEETPQWHPTDGVTAHLVPVIYLNLLSESRSKDLYAQILHFIGYPATGAERVIALAAAAALSTHGVRMIVIDDAHMLRTASVTGRATLNAVKHLNTVLGEAGGCLVLVGAELSSGPALADPQIRARLAQHALSSYAVDDTDERRTWQHFLKTCESVLLPYLPREAPGLFSSQHAGYVWLRTQGYVGDTAHLLIDAAHKAIADGVPLTREHLDAIRLSERAEDGWREHNRRAASPKGKRRRAR